MRSLACTAELTWTLPVDDTISSAAAFRDAAAAFGVQADIAARFEQAGWTLDTVYDEDDVSGVSLQLRLRKPCDSWPEARAEAAELLDGHRGFAGLSWRDEHGRRSGRYAVYEHGVLHSHG